MKRVLSLLFIISLLLGIVALSACGETTVTTTPTEAVATTAAPTEAATTAATEATTVATTTAEIVIATYGDYEYSINDDGTVSIVNYLGDAKNIVIPSEIDGMSVTKIGERAFYMNNDIMSVELPSTLTEIGKDAFAGCFRLIKVVNHSDVDISREMFVQNGSVSYYSSIIIDKNGERLPSLLRDDTFETDDGFIFSKRVQNAEGDVVYRLLAYLGEEETVTLPVSIEGSSYLIAALLGAKNVIIPEGITSIKREAFSGNLYLTSIKIPEGVTSIEMSTFNGCTNLKNVELPSSLTTIEINAFTGCTSLTEIRIPSGVTNINVNAFLGCSNLEKITVDEANTEYSSLDGVLFDKDKTTLVYCPEGKRTADYEIPDGVRIIGASAFRNNMTLTTVVIPGSVATIGGYAFFNCKSLKNVDLPIGLTEIGWAAFHSCDSLVSIKIPASVTVIGEVAFESCKSLSDIELSPALREIKRNTFSNCSSLKSIKIPASVTKIERSAFYLCTALEEISVDADNAAYTSLDGVLFDKDVTELICYPIAKSGEKYEIPSSVKIIGTNSFDMAKNLTQVIIPFGVTTISERAFACCAGITNIKIPSSVTTIGTSAFIRCENLVSIEIPSSVRDIGNLVFMHCDKLEAIYVQAGSYAEKYARLNGYKFVNTGSE